MPERASCSATRITSSAAACSVPSRPSTDRALPIGSRRPLPTWRHMPMSRCCAGPRPSVATTAISSDLIERVTDHLPAQLGTAPTLTSFAAPRGGAQYPSGSRAGTEWTPRQRLWKLRAKAVVLAAGAHERPIAYANNDLPGTMLAGAVRTYIERYAVRPGSRAVVFANNDSAYATALALQSAGVVVAAIVDPRAGSGLDGALPHAAREAGVPILAKSAIVGAHGTARVTAVDISPLAGHSVRHIECDLVAVSGGWDPAVHLHSQARGKLRYDDTLATFVPDGTSALFTPAGAANGRFDLAGALAEGHAAGLAAAAQAGFPAGDRLAAPHAAPVAAGTPRPLWSVPAGTRSAKRFVDLQNDVTVDDITLAAREGYQSVEHLKRYTTLGMGTDQGKQSNIVGLALLAERLALPIPQVGTTTFRAALHAGHAGRVPGTRVRRAHRADALLRDARLARRARRALRQRGPLETTALVPAGRRIGGRCGAARGEERAHQRRHRRRLDAGQDRTAGTRCRRIPESRLRQPLGHAGRGPLPLWRDAARRRHGVRRRHDVAPRERALPDDDDHRERRQGHAAPGDAAAGRLAGAPGLRDIGDRAVGRRRGVRLRTRGRCSRRSSTSTCRMQRSRSSQSVPVACAPPPASFPPGSSG